MTRAKAKAGEIEVFHGSGNVWEDLGFPNAEELLAGLGRDVDIVIGPSRRAPYKGRIRVSAG